MFEFINALRSSVAYIPNIGMGGCCRFSSIVAKELDRFGVSVNIRVGAFEVYNENALDIVNGSWRANGRCEDRGEIIFDHVFLEWKDVWFDHLECNQEFFVPCWPAMKVYKGYLELGAAQDLCCQPIWNHMFDVDFIPDIRRRVRQTVADFFA